MALTPKQVRNGIPDAGPEGGNVAQPGPSSDVAGPMGASEVYGNDWQESGRGAWTGQSAGSSGYSVPDWDASLAVTEGAGEA